jgi:O-antigen ligase
MEKLSFRDFFSFEFFIVILIFIGRFKKITYITNLPMDPTLVMLVIAALMSIPLLINWRERFDLHARLILSCFILFVCWAVISLSWTPNYHDALHKVLLLVGVCLPLYLWGILIASETERVQRVMRILFVFALIYAVMTLCWRMLHVHKGLADLFGSDPSSVSHITGLGMILSSFYLFFAKEKNWLQIIFLLCAFSLCTYVTLATAEKAAILAAVIVIFGQYGLFFMRTKNKIRYLPALLMLVAIIIMIFSPLFLTKAQLVPLIGRIVSDHAHLTFAETSVGIRWHLYQLAWQVFSKHIITGGGIGSFMVLSGVFKYPHNVILEIAAELGLIGLLLFSALLLWPCYVCLRYWRRIDINISVSLLSVFLYSLLIALANSSITSDRLLIISMGLLCFPACRNLLAKHRFQQVVLSCEY